MKTTLQDVSVALDVIYTNALKNPSDQIPQVKLQKTSGVGIPTYIKLREELIRRGLLQIIGNTRNQYMAWNTSKCGCNPTLVKDVYKTLYTVEIKIEAYQANFLRTLPLHSSQEKIERQEQFSIFRYNIVPTFEFIQELRKHGSVLEVLQPQWLRDEFRKDLEYQLSKYQDAEDEEASSDWCPLSQEEHDRIFGRQTEIEF